MPSQNKTYYRIREVVGDTVIFRIKIFLSRTIRK